MVRMNIPPAVGIPASTQVAVNWFKTRYHQWIDVPNLQQYLCATKIFNVAHILAPCGTVDRAALATHSCFIQCHTRQVVQVVMEPIYPLSLPEHRC